MYTQLRNQKIPPFMLKCINYKGEEVEMKPKVFQVYKYDNGNYIEYQPMEGDIKLIVVSLFFIN